MPTKEFQCFRQMIFDNQLQAFCNKIYHNCAIMARLFWATSHYVAFCENNHLVLVLAQKLNFRNQIQKV
jgi:hypothetical protein